MKSLTIFYPLFLCANFFCNVLKSVKDLFSRTTQGSYGYATFRVSGAKLCTVMVACVVGLVNAFKRGLIRGVDIHKSRVGEALEKPFCRMGSAAGSIRVLSIKSALPSIAISVRERKRFKPNSSPIAVLPQQYISEKISSELSVMFTLPIEICSQPVKVIIGWGI